MWQGDGELAAAGDVGDGDGATVRFDEAAGDGEPEAGAAGGAGGVAAPEPVEHLGQVRCGDATAAVPHPDDHGPIAAGVNRDE